MSQQPQETKTISTAPVGWAALGFFLVTVVVFGGLLSVALIVEWPDETLAGAIAAAIALQAVGCIVVIALFMRTYAIPAAEIGLVPPTRRMWHLAWQVPIILVGLSLINMGFFTLLFGPGASAPEQSKDFLRGLPVLYAVFGVLGVGILTPIWEELYFRGMLLRLFQLTIGVRWAVVASAAIFAVAHVQPLLFLYLFCAGVVMALMRKFYGNIWAPMVLHMVMNTFVVVMMMYG